jgi:2-keto-3-deoxy-L-rhamnonate aldolase RhmA
VIVFHADGAPTDQPETHSVSLRRTLDGTNPLIGVWINLADAASVDIIAASGFAWIGIDLQKHLVQLYNEGGHTSTELAELMQVGRSTVYRTLARARAQAADAGLGEG